MHLYGHLDKLGERTLYCDTDSFIFVQRADESPLIKYDDALGDLTSELKGNEYISNLLAGPQELCL